MKRVDFLCSLALANALLLPEWLNWRREMDVLAQLSDLGRSAHGTTSILLTVAILTGAFSLYLTLCRRVRYPHGLRLGLLCLFSLLIFPFDHLRILKGSPSELRWLSASYHLHWLLSPSAIPIFASLFLLALKYRRNLIPVSFAIARYALLALLPVLVVIGWHIGSVTVEKTPRRSPGALRLSSIGGPSPSRITRVVWMVFDEWDYDVTFGNRPIDLKLPSLEKLLEESVSAPGAVSPTHHTISSLPSLLTSEIIPIPLDEEDDLDFSKWMKWMDRRNVFDDVRALNEPASVIGWYLPYCALLAGLLEDCYTRSAQRFDYSENHLTNIASIAQRIVVRRPSWMNREHREDFEAIVSKSEQALQRNQRGLMFIHWPIPHRPIIYDRRSHALSDAADQADYSGNLILLDQTLAKMIDLIDSQNSRTLLILTSDHPLRHSKAYPQSGRRVPFLLRFPDKFRGSLAKDFPNLLTRQIAVSALRGEFHDSKGFLKWLPKLLD